LAAVPQVPADGEAAGELAGPAPDGLGLVDAAMVGTALPAGLLLAELLPPVARTTCDPHAPSANAAPASTAAPSTDPVRG
jgi:hypothetical protein